MSAVSRSETVRAGRSLLTPHPREAYPGLRVVRPGAWDLSLIVADEGDTILAAGGEKVYGYETVDGGRAAGFDLLPGDRATLVRLGLPHALAEWHIQRAGGR